jgi:choline transport protein
VYLIAVFYAAPDLTAVTDAASIFPIADLYRQATGSKAGTLGLQLLIFLPSFWGILGTYVTSGRTLWTLGRDNAAPFSHWLGQISPRHHGPMNATLAVVAINACIGLLYLGSTTAFSAFSGSVICLISISYLGAIVPHLLSGRKRVPPGWFFMKGATGTAVHVFSCVYVVVFVIIFCFPYSMPVSAGTMNYTSVIIGGISCGLALLWAWKSKHGYTGLASGDGVGRIIDGQPGHLSLHDEVHAGEEYSVKAEDRMS